MHFSMIFYVLNCSSRSHVVVQIIWEEKTHVIQGKKINPYKHFAVAMELTR